MKLHVSALESHHQAYKYCIIKKKNVQLLAGLYKKKLVFLLAILIYNVLMCCVRM